MRVRLEYRLVLPDRVEPAYVREVCSERNLQEARVVRAHHGEGVE